MKKTFTLIISFFIFSSAYCTHDDFLNDIAKHNDLDTLIETCNRMIQFADDYTINIIQDNTKYNNQYCKDIKQIAKDHPHLSYLLQTDLSESILNFADQIEQHIYDPNRGCKVSGNIYLLTENICYDTSSLSNHPNKRNVNCREVKKRVVLASAKSRRVVIYEPLPNKKTFVSCNHTDLYCNSVKNITNIIVDGHITPSIYTFYPDCSIDTKKYPNYYQSPQKTNEYVAELNQKHEKVTRQDIFYNLPNTPPNK